MIDKPKIIFVDLHGKEIFPVKYTEPDMTGIAMSDVNGQIKYKQSVDYNSIDEMEAAVW